MKIKPAIWTKIRARLKKEWEDYPCGLCYVIEALNIDGVLSDSVYGEIEARLETTGIEMGKTLGEHFWNLEDPTPRLKWIDSQRRKDARQGKTR